MKYIIGLLLIALVAIAGCTVEKETRTVETSGTATIEVQPDEAQVYVSIETKDDLADVAKDENAIKVDAVRAALEELDVIVETQNFNVYEQYDWSNGKRTSTGFVATHTLFVSTTNFDDLGGVIDASVNNGATRVNSIQFTISDERKSEFQADAIKAAAAEARNKAGALAAGIGGELGDVISVSNAEYNYNPYRYFDAAESVGFAAVEKAVDTEILPQALEVRATVNAVFELE